MNDQATEWKREDFTVSTDRARLSLDEAYTLLLTTFWGPSTTLATFKKAATNSVCFGLYDRERLVGFARIVTDLATYAYWADVVTEPTYRGQGLGQWLCECMLAHPELQGLRRIGLLTRDAMNLYSRLGFSTALGDLNYMERRSSRESTTVSAKDA